MLHTVTLPEPSDAAIYAAVEQRMSDPSGPDTQRILFAEHLAWIAEQGFSSLEEQGADLTREFSFADWREAAWFKARWCAG